MATSVIIEEQVEIPGDILTLADFRRWALSDEFPAQGRIDYIGRRIEVDMWPEVPIHHLAEGRYVAAELDAEGFQPSRVFGRRFRLDGRRDQRGFWRFDLVGRE